MITSSYHTIQKYPIHILEAGSGPPVFLLHGFAASAESWQPTMTVLAQHGYHAIAVDALGFGRSAQPDDAPYSLQLYADLYAGLLDVLDLPRAAFVAHSMGGKFALATALLHPERVSRLFLAATDGFSNPDARSHGHLSLLPAELALHILAQPPVIRMFLSMAFYQPASFVTPDMVDYARQVLGGRTNRRALLALNRCSGATDLTATGLRSRLGKLRCPTLLIWGMEDRVLGIDQAYTARREIPGAQLVTLPRCGHFPQIEAFRAFHGLLPGFLATPGVL